MNPLLYLAPMEDVTDTSFRKLCKFYGADVVTSEFVASEALVRDAQKTIQKIHFDDKERPFGVQIFGNKVSVMRDAAQIVAEWHPDFIDLNFGCPVKKIVSKGAGASLLKDIPLMLEITKTVVQAVALPVTVKTRLGWDEQNKPIVKLAEQLQDCGIHALCIHGRTRSQMYSGKADWQLITAIKNNPRFVIPLIGNGDIDSGKTALAKYKESGVDGLMVGRASIGRPWIFAEIKSALQSQSYSYPDAIERLQILRRHLTEAVQIKGEKRGVLEMRRHYASYLKGMLGIKLQKMQLMQALSLDEVMKITQEMMNLVC